MYRYLSTGLAALIGSGAMALAKPNQNAAQQFKKPQADRNSALSPEEQQKTFTLADGFVIELVASEEHGLINPIDLTFDDAGRLWTQTAQMYPLDPISGINFRKALQMMVDPNLDKKFPRVVEIRDLYQLKKRGDDKILILDNPTQTATKNLQVWADGLSIPQSIFPYKDGCYVAHGSEFFFLDDQDGDGKQDSVETVMTGFGFFDTHTMAHSIVRGPGGWLNFTHGALNAGDVTLTKNNKKVKVEYAKNLRYSLDGENLEIVGTAKDNVWGYQIRANGQWYATSANDNGLSVLPVEDQTGIDGIGGKKIRSYQPMIKSVHEFRVGGSGISGLAFSEDGAHGFPAEWGDVAFLANPITNTINCVRIKRLPTGEIIAEHLDDLLSCSDQWFRPVNIEMGPDGCLYIADWYNKIVSHNEVSTDHPDRDRKHGRIWRVRHESQKPFTIPNLVKAENSALVGHLSGGKTLWEKRAAWHQIVDRQAKEVAPQLIELLRSNAAKEDVILALWCLEGLKHYDEASIKAAIASIDGDVRREAIRSLASYDLPVETIVSLVQPYAGDDNAMVRSQVLRTLQEIQEANTDSIDLLVQACKPATGGIQFGNGYEAHFERFLARKALETYPDELITYLKSPKAKECPSENLLWAVQALPEKTRLDFFIANWKKNKGKEMDDNTFVSLCEILGHPKMRAVAEPSFTTRRDEMLALTIKNREAIDLPFISGFFAQHIEALLSQENTMGEGIKLIRQLYSPHHTKTLMRLLKKYPDQKTAIISALASDPKMNTAVYFDLYKEGDFSQKLNALAALFLRDAKGAHQRLVTWLPTLSEAQVETVVSRLSHTRQGSAALLTLTEKKVIPMRAWTIESATRSQGFLRKHKMGARIKAAAAKREEIANAQRHKKVKEYVTAYQKLKGNPEMGKGLFSACLICHQAGNEGVSVGPPLDGGANRNVEHLITAIVNPDEAVEGAYGLYAVVKRDGSVIEAMLKKKTTYGTTLVSPGGGQTYIPKHLILSEGGISGRSFMPKNFGIFPDQAMADLVSYIKTIK